jgi:SAM-dependent methyltransferase
MHYYGNRHYHTDWIAGINATWRSGVHDAQLRMCELIPPGSSILEVGCGDGSCAFEIATRIAGIRYVGIDLNPGAWKCPLGLPFVGASADALPFSDGSFDAIVSMFVVEHLVFPARFLDEAWRVLRPGGGLFTIAPDFISNPMSSERIGWSYGPGRSKLKSGRVLDALMTAYDTRCRIARSRRRRRHRLAKGVCSFPILMMPRCLRLSGFVPDCDAVYPACPEELQTYLRSKPDCLTVHLFHRDPSVFGLQVMKAPPARCSR